MRRRSRTSEAYDPKKKNTTNTCKRRKLGIPNPPYIKPVYQKLAYLNDLIL